MNRSADGPKKRQQLFVVTREVVAGTARSDQPARIVIGVVARRPIGNGCFPLSQLVEVLDDEFAINPRVTTWLI